MKQLVFLLFPLFSFAQDSVKKVPVTIEKYEWVNHIDSYRATLSNGDIIEKGTKLKLGTGTMPNGDFTYISAVTVTEAHLKRTTQLKEIKVVDLERKGNKKYGYKYIFEAQGGFIIQLENAIATGEIVLNH